MEKSANARLHIKNLGTVNSDRLEKSTTSTHVLPITVNETTIQTEPLSQLLPITSVTMKKISFCVNLLMFPTLAWIKLIRNGIALHDLVTNGMKINFQPSPHGDQLTFHSNFRKSLRGIRLARTLEDGNVHPGRHLH